MAGVRSILYIYTLRWRQAVKEFEKYMALAAGGTSPVLSDLSPSYRPVFCTTDLGSGTHFYISDKFVAGAGPSLRGTGITASEAETINLVGAAPSWPVASAVMASAAFPGVIQPVLVSASTFGLPHRSGAVPARIRLADGGLYDNLGFSLPKIWHDGNLDAALKGDLGAPPTYYLIANSGLPAFKWSRRLGPIRSFQRSFDVVHQANGRARREQISAFLAAHDSLGSMVGIGDDPYAIADGAPNSDRGKLVVERLDSLLDSDARLSRSWWRAVSQEWNPSVKTTLKGLGNAVTARLVFHGYMVTLARMTTDLGCPLPTTIRTPKQIEKLCS